MRHCASAWCQVHRHWPFCSSYWCRMSGPLNFFCQNPCVSPLQVAEAHPRFMRRQLSDVVAAMLQVPAMWFNILLKFRQHAAVVDLMYPW